MNAYGRSDGYFKNMNTDRGGFVAIRQEKNL